MQIGVKKKIGPRFFCCIGIGNEWANVNINQFKPVFHFYTPENVRKTLVFWRFQGI